jgi:hypothetical protein
MKQEHQLKAELPKTRKAEKQKGFPYRPTCLVFF